MEEQKNFGPASWRTETLDLEVSLNFVNKGSSNPSHCATLSPAPTFGNDMNELWQKISNKQRNPNEPQLIDGATHVQCITHAGTLGNESAGSSGNALPAPPANARHAPTQSPRPKKRYELSSLGLIPVVKQNKTKQKQNIARCSPNSTSERLDPKRIPQRSTPPTPQP